MIDDHDERPPADQITAPDRISLGHHSNRPPKARIWRWLAAVRARTDPRLVSAIALIAAIVLVATLAYAVSRDDGGRPAGDAPSAQPTAGSQPEDETGDSPLYRRSERPDPIAQMPLGDPPAVPYYAHGSVRWPDGVAPVEPRTIFSLVSRAGASLAVTRSQKVVLFQGASLVTLDNNMTSGPVIGPDARLAAWISGDGGRYGSLEVWNLRTKERQISRPLDLGFTCCDHPGVQVVGIDADGRVYVTARGHHLMWDRPTNDLIEIRGTAPHVSMTTVTPAGPVFTNPASHGKHERTTFGTVGHRGDFTALGQTRAGSWSPDGDIVAYEVSESTVVAQPVDGMPVMLQTPHGVGLGQIMWESDQTILVVATSDRHSSWLRCDPSTGNCEIAADLGDTGRFRHEWIVATNSPVHHF